MTIPMLLNSLPKCLCGGNRMNKLINIVGILSMNEYTNIHSIHQQEPVVKWLLFLTSIMYARTIKTWIWIIMMHIFMNLRIPEIIKNRESPGHRWTMRNKLHAQTRPAWPIRWRALHELHINVTVQHLRFR
jgi:hypothetical protein